MARFYADENFPLPAVQMLRRLGHDVLTIGEAGMPASFCAPTILTTRARRSVLTNRSAESLY
jgi:hypothetical protein